VLGNLKQAAIEAPSLPPAGTFRLARSSCRDDAAQNGPG